MRVTKPSPSRCFKRLVRVRELISFLFSLETMECCSSQNRRGPVSKSRVMSTVHMSAMCVAAAATGQVCLVLLTTPLFIAQ